jgi:anti-sigma regulatory factor (Ser/Thr protein kinase)
MRRVGCDAPGDLLRRGIGSARRDSSWWLPFRSGSAPLAQSVAGAVSYHVPVCHPALRSGVKLTIPRPEYSYERFEREVLLSRRMGKTIIRLTIGRRKLDLPGLAHLLNHPMVGQVYRGEVDGSRVHLVIDLRECLFVDPCGLTVLHALCTRVVHGVDRIWLCLPEDLGVQNYCGVTGFSDGIRTCATLVGEVAGGMRPSYGCEVLLPITTISAESDAQQISRAARERLDGLLTRLRWPRAVADGTVSAIMEVAMNVVEYAQSTGYLTLQGYRLEQTNGFLVVAISDAGVGVRATLAEKYTEFQDPAVPDGVVLGRLVREGLSARPGRSGGLGVKTLRDAIRTIGGRLDLRSGRGLFRQIGYGVNHTTGVLIPGTHVRLSLDAPRT